MSPAFAAFPRPEYLLPFPDAVALSSWASVATKKVVCGIHAERGD